VGELMHFDNPIRLAANFGWKSSNRFSGLAVRRSCDTKSGDAGVANLVSGTAVMVIVLAFSRQIS